MQFIITLLSVIMLASVEYDHIPVNFMHAAFSDFRVFSQIILFPSPITCACLSVCLSVDRVTHNHKLPVM